MYTGTYGTANTLRTLFEAYDADPTVALCVGVTSVNTSLSMVKDRALAQIFGAASAVKGVPLAAYGWWLGRDAVTMGMVFTAPPRVSSALQGALGWSSGVADTVATLAIPVIIQPVTTFCHLWGLDVCKRPSDVTVGSRLSVMSKCYGESLIARTGRIFVPYVHHRCQRFGCGCGCGCDCGCECDRDCECDRPRLLRDRHCCSLTSRAPPPPRSPPPDTALAVW